MGGEYIRGRKRIADALDRSEKTVSRWIDHKIIKTAVRSGPFPNSPIAVRSAEIVALREQYPTAADLSDDGAE